MAIGVFAGDMTSQSFGARRIISHRSQSTLIRSAYFLKSALKDSTAVVSLAYRLMLYLPTSPAAVTSHIRSHPPGAP